MSTMRAPGIYIKETKAFGKSIPTSDTAIPFFIGFTQRRPEGQDGVIVKEIGKMAEYIKFFGYGHFQFGTTEKEAVTAELTDASATDVASTGKKGKAKKTTEKEAANSSTTVTKGFYLYESLKLYFANGGGRCYVASAGLFPTDTNSVEASLNSALESLAAFPKENLIVVPDAVVLKDDKRGPFISSVLAKCAPTGGYFNNNFAIFDTKKSVQKIENENTTLDQVNDDITRSYGAMYHPWLKPSAITAEDVTQSLLSDDATVTAVLGWINAKLSSAKSFSFTAGVAGDHITSRKKDIRNNPKAQAAFDALVKECRMLEIPPSGAVAGAFVKSDQRFGIQKAPANINLEGVQKLSQHITDEMQADFNAPDNGKGINCIRTLLNNGIRIYGARTLNGRDNDYRYVNVRRTMSMLQESIKGLMQEFVFDDNNAKTWGKMRLTLDKFLRKMMSRGVLQGTTPSEAFAIRLGYGETMTEEDVNNGEIKVEVQLALIRPAEFIELSFEQKSMEVALVDPTLN